MKCTKWIPLPPGILRACIAVPIFRKQPDIKKQAGKEQMEKQAVQVEGNFDLHRFFILFLR